MMMSDEGLGLITRLYLRINVKEAVCIVEERVFESQLGPEYS